MVLPPGGHGRIGAASLRRWLSRGKLGFVEPQSEMLITVLNLLGVPVPADGLAALRFWGQTGERSSAWMAAADPVHLETRLHTLRLRALRPDELPRPELRILFEHLQSRLGAGSGFSFTRLGDYGYVHSADAFSTAPMSASVLHGLPPDEYVPPMESATVYHRLTGEIQMTLHEHEVNQRRLAAGDPEINSLWVWGGGVAPESTVGTLPLLIADDALFRGYWHSRNGDGMDWGADIEKMNSGFVAVVPDLPPDEAGRAMVDGLKRIKRMLTRGTIRSATLLFRDGLSIEIKRSDTFRIWRGESPQLRKKESDD